jgi:spermidine synthase
LRLIDLECPAIDMESIVEWHDRVLTAGFGSARYGSTYISSYPTGQIGFMLCHKAEDYNEASMLRSIEERFERMTQMGVYTSYYHPPLHASSFVLPLWVHNKLYGARPTIEVVSSIVSKEA